MDRPPALNHGLFAPDRFPAAPAECQPWLAALADLPERAALAAACAEAAADSPGALLALLGLSPEPADAAVEIAPLTDAAAARLALRMQERGAAWGVLAGGAGWRLYHHASAHALDRYVELDLAALAGDEAALDWLLLCFHHASLAHPAAGAAALAGASAEAAAEAGRLIWRQAREAGALLAGAGATPAAALILVTRSLALLWAEARGAPPFAGPPRSRRGLSLRGLLERREWGADDLLALFEAVWRQLAPAPDPAAAPTLFDPAALPALEIGEPALRQALTGLAGAAIQPLDYARLELLDLALICGRLLDPACDPPAEQLLWLGWLATGALPPTICDPALGGGAALLAAAHWLTVRLLAAGPAGWTLAECRRQVVSSSLFGLAPQPAGVALAGGLLGLLAPASPAERASLLRHLRAGRPGGVWLADLRQRASRPRRQGRAAPDQLSLLDAPAEQPPAPLPDRDQLLADALAAAGHGLALDAKAWALLVEYADNPQLGSVRAVETLIARTRHLAERERWVHWELAFADVFAGGSGFAALVSVAGADWPAGLLEQAPRLLAAGAPLALLLPAAWLADDERAPLRRLLRQIRLDVLTLFPAAADATPARCALLAANQPPGAAATISVTAPPAAAGPVAAAAPYALPLRSLGRRAWSLERPEIQALFEALRRSGAPLADLPGGLPAPGLPAEPDPAFVIDQATRARLIERDPHSAEMMAPYLPATGLDRWLAQPAERWILALHAGADWPWSAAGDQAEPIFRQRFFAVYWHLKSREAQLKAALPRRGRRFWWEWEPGAGTPSGAGPLILAPRLLREPRFCLELGPVQPDAACLAWRSTDRCLLGWLASPVAWWLLGRLPRDSDGAIRLEPAALAGLPLAQPRERARRRIEATVDDLLNLTLARRVALDELADWLRADFEVPALSPLLAAPHEQDAGAFADEVRRRRSKLAVPLGAAGLRALREGCARHAEVLGAVARELDRRETELAGAVFAAHRLAPALQTVLWRSLPAAPAPAAWRAARFFNDEETSHE